MKNYQESKEKYLNIRVSEEEKSEFKQNAGERGVSVTEYIKEKCLGNNRGGIYNKEVQQALEIISNILYYKIEKYCEDEAFVKECKGGVERLWHCLK